MRLTPPIGYKLLEHKNNRSNEKYEEKPMIAIGVNNLKKSFGDLQAVQDVTFQANAGDSLA